MLLEVALVVEEALHINSRLIDNHACDFSRILIAKNALNHGVYRITHQIAPFVTLSRLQHAEVNHLRSGDLHHRRLGLLLRLTLKRHHIDLLGRRVGWHGHRLGITHHIVGVGHTI